LGLWIGLSKVIAKSVDRILKKLEKSKAAFASVFIQDIEHLTVGSITYK
jgi:hypothetical protein